MIIKSTTFVNNYGAISNLAHEVEEPIYVTENGEGDIVIMSVNAYEKRDQLLKFKPKVMMTEEPRISETSKISETPTISVREVRTRGKIYHNEQ